jgi:hypothetical protein
MEIFVNNSNISFESNTFTNCSSDKYGGALYFHQIKSNISF